MCHMVGDKLVAVGGINLLPHTPGIGVVNLRTGQAQEFSFPVSELQLLFMRLCSSFPYKKKRTIIKGDSKQRHELA